MGKSLQKAPLDLIETVLVLLLLLALLLALYDVLRVFFGIFTFALIFSVSFSEPFEWLARLLGNRRKWAAVIYALLLFAIVALPFVFLVSTIKNHIREAVDWMEHVRTNGLPVLPAWITSLPLVGGDIGEFWAQMQNSPKEAFAQHEGQIRAGLRQVVTGGAGMIGTVLQCVAAVVISAILLVSGERILNPVKTAFQYLLGRRDGLVVIEATILAIRSVSIGVMGTAFIAAVVSWIGLTIAGIGFAVLLAALVFFCVLIQIGPLLVWVPVVIWSASQGHTGGTIFLIIYGIGLLVLDALLKPVLIAKAGGKLPFLVLFLGVIGGLAAWGFTGMFKGAIIMSVFYTVFTSWIARKSTTNS
jgi:predicted PurR-regulated permease PerM